MSCDNTTGAGAPHDTGTPVFDATVQALAATHPTTETALGVPSASNDIANDTASDIAGDANADGTEVRRGLTEDTEDPVADWVDQRYGDPSTPTPMIDPDTPEGAAILLLFRSIKDIEESDGNWPGVDVVQQLTTWFTDLGIDPDEQPVKVGRRLRLALRDRAGGERASAVYGVRIGTDHDDSELLIRTALHVLARQLGPGTSIDLVSHDRDVLARIDHPRASMAGS